MSGKNCLKSSALNDPTELSREVASAFLDPTNFRAPAKKPWVPDEPPGDPSGTRQ